MMSGSLLTIAPDSANQFVQIIKYRHGAVYACDEIEQEFLLELTALRILPRFLRLFPFARQFLRGHHENFSIGTDAHVVCGGVSLVGSTGISFSFPLSGAVATPADDGATFA